MTEVIFKLAFICFLWFVTGFSVCAAVPEKDTEFIVHSIWFGVLALSGTVFFVWSFYPA